MLLVTTTFSLYTAKNESNLLLYNNIYRLQATSPCNNNNKKGKINKFISLQLHFICINSRRRRRRCCCYFTILYL